MFTLIGILGRVSADISEDVIVILEASIVLIYVQLIYVYRVIFSLLPSRKRCIFSFPLHVQNRTGWVAAPLTLDNDLAEPVTPDFRSSEMIPKIDTIISEVMQPAVLDLPFLSTWFWAGRCEISENRSPVS